MKFKFSIGILISALLISCAHKSSGPFHELAHDSLIQELKDRKTGRSPSSVEKEFQVKLEDLSRISPKQFEVYVFPKVTHQNEKTSEKINYLGRPEVFEVSVLAVSPCRSFIQGSLFSRLGTQDIFPLSLAEDGQRQCSIIEISSRALRTMPRGNLKKDDLLKVRLFLDESYKIYASDFEHYENPQTTRMSRIKARGRNVFTGLNLYPIELPNSEAKFIRTDVTKLIHSKIDGISQYQVRRKFNQKFSLPSCKGGVVEQKNSLGGQTTLGWCQRLPWPVYSENERFISVVQTLSLK